MFVVLRIAIGWHFAREGFVKLSHPSFSAVGYLANAYGPFSDIFHSFAANAAMMSFINVFIPWALFLAGMGLMLGLFTRVSIVVAMGCLAMFYCAAPPIEPAMGAMTDWPVFETHLHSAQWAANMMKGNEGNYVLVNKNLIELLALGALLTIDSGKMAGFDAVISQWFGGGKQQ